MKTYNNNLTQSQIDKLIENLKKIQKSKFYAVNLRQGVIYPIPYNKAGQIIEARFPSPDVFPFKGSSILADTAFKDYRIEFFV